MSDLGDFVHQDELVPHLRMTTTHGVYHIQLLTLARGLHANGVSLDLGSV